MDKKICQELKKKNKWHHNCCEFCRDAKHCKDKVKREAVKEEISD